MRMPKTIGFSLALLVASSAAFAKQNKPVHQPAASIANKATPGTKAKAAKKIATAQRPGSKRDKASGKPIARASSRIADRRQRAGAHHGAHRTAASPEPGDPYIGPVRATGVREIGRAAWYGRHHVGKRTASGEPLDAVRATAAHRTLPLQSLVRVTNLRNGRTVIARINDRGPVSRSLLIDMSPGAAEQLDMQRSGIVDVAIEPVTLTGNIGSSAAP